VIAKRLDGMSSEQLMLHDLIYEINEALEEAREAPVHERLGLRRIAKLFEIKLETFEIDQSKFARPLVDVDAWFAGKTS
jgi:hypothetical protein